MVLQKDNIVKNQLRNDLLKRTYSDLDPEEKLVAWHISALDAMTMPVLNQTQYFNYFEAWYTGFGNGLFYISPGIYNLTIYDDINNLKVNN